MSQEEEPLEGIPVLGYAGGTGPLRPQAGQAPAFNARRRFMWSGEHLFRIYLTPEFIYFIRIGGARNQEQLMFGVFIGYLLAKGRREKEVARAEANDGKYLELLLQEHKRNHVFPTTDISNVVLEKRAGGRGTRRSSRSG